MKSLSIVVYCERPFGKGGGYLHCVSEFQGSFKKMAVIGAIIYCTNVLYALVFVTL